MTKKRLIWRVFPAFLLITLVSLFAIAWYASQSMRRFYMQIIETELTARARVVESRIASLMAANEHEKVDRVCKELGRLSETRITAVRLGGQVIGDSDEDPARMDNHRDRPEMVAAFKNERGAARRFSGTLQRSMLYVAIPLTVDGKTVGAVRTARPLNQVEDALHQVYLQITLGGLGVGAAAMLVSLLVTRHITRPLEDIRDGAVRFARGELTSRLPAFDSLELDQLASTMNLMAMQLDERIRTINAERSETEAVLTSMAEGVIAVDRSESIIRINRTAGAMLNIEPQDALGKNLRAIARNPKFLELLSATLAETSPTSTEVLFHGNTERCLQIHGTALIDADNRRLGAVLVMNDVTGLRKLENLRRDFVANVSHELKTPITSIQGFVETLLDGALDNRHDARRFLDIINAQTKRLNAIIEDLLLLSRIESDDDKNRAHFQKLGIKGLLENAMAICEPKAQAKNIALNLDCTNDFRIAANSVLFEQAIVNLIDNAINYSPPDTTVQIKAELHKNQALISIRDFGHGIPAEHLPRIFERFYRVDKARSRKLGGTGLGLAIVKHVVQEHGGIVTAESIVDQGSIFTIRLPASANGVERQ